jgi:hypothetical protein
MTTTCRTYSELSTIEKSHRSQAKSSTLPEVATLHGQCALDSQRVIRLHAARCAACIAADAEGVFTRPNGFR